VKVRVRVRMRFREKKEGMHEYEADIERSLARLGD
jgi:hypothetical protein